MVRNYLRPQPNGSANGPHGTSGRGRNCALCLCVVCLAGLAETQPMMATETQVDAATLDPPPGGRRLHPEYRVWIDGQRGQVMVDGWVTLRHGVLEMFACPQQTKEHESIVAVDCEVFIIHAALLQLGAEPGHPAVFVPEYQPPTGSVVEVTVQWRSEDGQLRQSPAQQWVRGVKGGAPLAHDWVFAGSSFWRDEATGKSHYQAQAGFFICVANFGAAMLDIPIESTDANGEQVFEANTEAIPPVGTPVRLLLRPRPDPV